MNWIMEAGIALSMVALCGGFVAYLIMSKVFRWIKEMEGQEKSNQDLEKRIKDLEQRVMDMQEIILSIDEGIKHSQISVKESRIESSPLPVETA